MWVVGVWLAVGCGSSVESEPIGGGEQGGEGLGGGPAAGGGDLGGENAGAGDSQGGDSQGGAGQGGAGQGGEGGAPSEVCAAMQLITLSAPELIEAGGDQVWSPGETAVLRVALTNESVNDNFHYPGVAISSELAGITPGDNTLFGIFGSSTTELDVWVSADAALAAGTEVVLDVAVTTLSDECSDLNGLTAAFTLE